MPKTKTVYVCQSCGAESPRWLGQCPSCSAWNSLVETITKSSANIRASSAKISPSAKLISLSEIQKAEQKRVTSGVSEFDQVIGGGFVPGQVVLLAGEPGVGKSTLLLQIANDFGGNVLYISGEESAGQIGTRAKRLKVESKNLLILETTDVDEAIATAAAAKDLGLIIIDSIQVLATTDLEGQAGTVGQVRECAFRLSRFAKEKNVPLILVGHVTKEGAIAGPKVLEHLVDTVLYLEGDRSHTFRLLSATKNRFGPVGEVGVFEMAESGMMGVANPSDRFLAERDATASGSVVTVVMEGNRPMLLEIQALTVGTNFGYPRRTSSGFSLNRLLVLLAVLQKRLSLPLQDKDVYLNISSGVTISEPAADLAVCLAIASAVKGKPLGAEMAAFGEVGLSGEVRKVDQQERREKEAKLLGFAEIISPASARTLAAALKQCGLAYVK